MVKKLSARLRNLGESKVLVIGDLMLDTYTIGKVRRISPEAPVAVLQVQKEEHRAGGAGNVMLNLISLGASVVAIGRVGQDETGTKLCRALEAEHIDVRGIVTHSGFVTPVKNRIIANNQQIVRVDHETALSIPELLEQQIVESLPELLQDVKIVAISDYGKGLLTKTLLAALIDQAKAYGIPVIADPKGNDFTKYMGVHVLKPNLQEAYAAANLPLDAPLEQVADKVLEQSQAEALMITRSEEGISLFYRDGQREDLPVSIREIRDVTGAGDTVLAMLAYAMANQLSLSDAAQLSNLAAGIAIEHFGCARVSLTEVARRLLEKDTENKVFDADHLFVLEKALFGRKYALLAVQNCAGLSPLMFNLIRNLSQEKTRDLVVYLSESNPNPHLIDLLASLQEVSFIMLKGENLRALSDLIQPDEVHIVDDQVVKQVDNLEQLWEIEV